VHPRERRGGADVPAGGRGKGRRRHCLQSPCNDVEGAAHPRIVVLTNQVRGGGSCLPAISLKSEGEINSRLTPLPSASFEHWNCASRRGGVKHVRAGIEVRNPREEGEK